MKLQKLQASYNKLPQTTRQAPSPSEQRITGRALQARRFRKWTENPCCVACGRLTDWPNGFELDHKQRLDQYGSDTDENTQVMCVWWDAEGRKQGCHEAKTRAETNP